ncbi:hypothetical protein SCLCIDRAFT_33471 [Scleroderma citrinum Foug A]|uniref:Uncharacterized protein n=1 Tax=Scleroderma citrinum Foug A TaxID=1036808 RepID=A0A0C2YNU2_9AGAM|nr:hypothetical protein SCLCIDRAFT_33471 [Scleroderma citrinum Foug A]
MKVIDSNMEIVARPSDGSRSGSGQALLQHMDRLILAVENLVEAQWYTASAFEGVGPGEEDEEEEMDTEVVDQEAVKQEVLEPWPLDNEM